MFVNNYNGGPEILLCKNDDLYSSLVTVSEKEYISYSIIRDNIVSKDNSVFNNSLNNLTIHEENEPVNEIKDFNGKIKIIVEGKQDDIGNKKI